MSVEIPGQLKPVFSFYGVPWPTINEDAFHELKDPLQRFGVDVLEVADAAHEALGVLISASNSKALTQLDREVTVIKRVYLEPISDLCNNLSGMCDDAFSVVQEAKWALIGIVSTQVADDTIAIASMVLTAGLDAPAATAQMVLVRELVRTAIREGEQEIERRVRDAALSYIANFVAGIVEPFIDSAAERIEGEIYKYISSEIDSGMIKDWEGQALHGAAGKFHVSPGHLTQCVSDVSSSTRNLWKTTKDLESAFDHFDSSVVAGAPEGESTTAWATVVQLIERTIKEELIRAVNDLVDGVKHHLIDILNQFQNAVDDMDSTIARSAKSPGTAAAIGAGVGLVGGGMTTPNSAHGAVDHSASEFLPTASASADFEAERARLASEEQRIAARRQAMVEEETRLQRMEEEVRVRQELFEEEMRARIKDEATASAGTVTGPADHGADSVAVGHSHVGAVAGLTSTGGVGAVGAGIHAASGSTGRGATDVGGASSAGGVGSVGAGTHNYGHSYGNVGGSSSAGGVAHVEASDRPGAVYDHDHGGSDALADASTTAPSPPEAPVE